MKRHKNKRPMALYGGHPSRSWYSIEAKAETPDHAEVMIYDEIGMFGVGAKAFVADLKAVKAKTITLRMNSPGGDVFDGVAIAQAIKEHPATVTVQVDGLAASIASIIAMAGDEVTMAKGAFLMIHNPWMLAIGDAADMRHAADTLDKVQESLIRTYADETKNTQRQVREWMDAETWFTADEAVEHGFADRIVDTNAAKAAFDLTVFNNAPEGIAAETQDKPTVRDIEMALRDLGLSRKESEAFVAKGKDALQGEPEAPQGDPALSRLLAALESRTTQFA